MNWDDAYHQALKSGTSAAGYYNHNIPVDLDGSRVIIRVPVDHGSIMDLRLWPEPDVLRTIEGHVDNTPRLLHVSQDPAYQVHEFISGTVLNEIAPRGVPIPDRVLTDTASLFATLAGMPTKDLPDLPESWPADSDTRGFAKRLNVDSQRVFKANLSIYRRLYEQLGVPADPFAPVQILWERMTPRRFALVHADVHRKNIIIQDDRSFFLDWELALYGDPVYDLAAHLHKTAYFPHESNVLIERWHEALPSDCTEGYVPDLNAYLTHEQIKSVLVDTVRYAQAFAGGPAPHPLETLVTKLTEMLGIARLHWGITEPVDKVEVEAVLRQEFN